MTKFQAHQMECAASARRAAERDPKLAFVYLAAAAAHERMAQYPSLAKAQAATR